MAKNLETRRNFFRTSSLGAAALGGLAASPAKAQLVIQAEWEKHFPTPPKVYERLDQGMFELVSPKEDRFGQTELLTSPTDDYVPNPGMGYQVYPYEEKGTPDIPGETEAESIEKLIKLPFCDSIYMRTDWRVIQQRPGRLDLPEMWKYSIELAKKHGKRISFRIQLGNTVGYPRCSVPDFVLKRSGGVVDIKGWLTLPHYEHPEFLAAFGELNRMLADLYDKDPDVEYMDLMGYGAWGEWHARHYPVFPSPLVASRTLCGMVEEQMDAWVSTPLAMVAHGGTAEIRLKDVIALAMRGGCWWRRDNLSQALKSSDAYMLTHRPPWTAGVIEDGRYRNHAIGDPAKLEDETGIHIREHITMKALDVNASYWALWQHAENILKFREAYPHGFRLLDRHLGYKVRPSWVFVEANKTPQALIVAVKNEGCAPPPGILRVYASDGRGRFKVGGGLDPGTPGPSSLRQCRIVLPLGVDWKNVRLSAELEIKGIRHRVRWACREKLNPDGSVTLRRTPGLRS